MPNGRDFERKINAIDACVLSSCAHKHGRFPLSAQQSRLYTSSHRFCAPQENLVKFYANRKAWNTSESRHSAKVDILEASNRAGIMVFVRASTYFFHNTRFREKNLPLFSWLPVANGRTIQSHHSYVEHLLTALVEKRSAHLFGNSGCWIPFQSFLNK